MRDSNPTTLVKWAARGLVLGLTGCVEPYAPAVLDIPASYLVVDGFINGNGRTRIKLARTTSLASMITPPVEKGAKLLLVDEADRRYAFSEPMPGFYQSDSLQLPSGHQYQLRITTTAGVTYASDPVPLKVTPVIDKLAWRLNGDQIELDLATHDASQQSRYYRWSFVETWQFNAGLHANLEYYAKLPSNPVGTRSTPIYTCWRTERPSTIKQTSTAQLSLDALTDFPLLTIPARAERLKIRYSVLVSQVTETAEEFAYYEQLRKNTEALGTVNDPLPTQLTGNLHRIDNASEPVLGFVGAHTAQQQRLFIDENQLPPHPDGYYNTPYNACAPASFLYLDDKESVIEQFASSQNIPLDFIKDSNNEEIGIFGASVDCADCRTRGTTTKPSFW